MTKKFRQELIDSMIKGVADYAKARFDAEPELETFSCGSLELCDALLATGIRCRIFNDDRIKQILKDFGHYRFENGMWIFHRKISP